MPCAVNDEVPSAGVAVIARDARRPATVKPADGELAGFAERARVGMFYVHGMGPLPLFVFNVYGQAGASSDSEARSASQRLFAAIARETGCVPHVPIIIWGDLNSDIQDTGGLHGL
eukprot:15461652-Alexandrium_andersonii.AAC.1